MTNSVLKPFKKIIDIKKLEYIGFKKEYHQIQYMEKGGFPFYSQRAPLCFKECQNLSKGIYFSNYFNFMGKTREVGMLPILKNISRDLNTGKIGMVTNNSSIEIVGDAIVGDIIESHIGIKNIVNESTLELFFEWEKVLEDGSTELIAYGDMGVSWVLILDHGIVKAEPLPKYYMDYINQLKAPDELFPYVHNVYKNYANSLEKGESLYLAPHAPRRGKVLMEEIISTTLEDGNSVGNIYFAHYSRWQGLVRDKFFHQINPEYFKGIGQDGEFLAVNASVDHLREIMPFDTVLVTMNVVAVWKNSFELTFTYYKVTEDDKIKLATGKQTVFWVKKQNDNSFNAYPLPEEFLTKLLK